MRNLSTELKVGFFALFVLAVLVFMTFKVGGLEWLKKEGTPYYVSFRNIAGLDEKTKVKIAGVDAGIIEKIELKQGEARLMIRMDKGIQLYSDAAASIKASGLLGDKYLDIKVGSKPPLLTQGDTIRNVLEVVDIDDMLRKLSKVSENISTLAESLNESFGTEEAKRSLRAAVLNIGDDANGSSSIFVSKFSSAPPRTPSKPKSGLPSRFTCSSPSSKSDSTCRRACMKCYRY